MKHFLLTALLTMTAPAWADVIFDNGTLDLDTAFYSDYQATNVGAEDFVLAAGSETITDIHWWGAYVDNNAVVDDFTILIYGDDGGVPDAGNVVYSLAAGAVNRTSTGTQISMNFDAYEYSIVTAPITLTAGSTYYLSIVNSTPTGTWGWATSASTGGHYTDDDPVDGDFNGSPYDLAFQLTNDAIVPEPASLLLLGCGLGGIAWRRRRLRRS